ncbi:MAG: catalase [Pirellulaceae bacterium]|nr:catalase [Pirellulaceae bacterium]
MQLELGKEYPPADEARFVQQIIDDSIALRKRTKTERFRGQHAKATAGLKAKFEVLDIEDSRARHGLFSQPRSFDAILRFSNGTGRIQPDLIKDGRGLAIKLMIGNAGDSPVQDFVMINFKSFPIRDAKQYAAFMRWRLHLSRLPEAIGSRMMPAFFLFTPSRISQFARVARHVPKKISSVVEEEYHSMSPYRLGTAAIKFSVSPETFSRTSSVPSSAEDDFLTKELAERLRKDEVALRMRVQFQQDPNRHPVEDASVIWEGKDVVDVARVVLPQQELASEDSQQFARSIERMSFNPWHTLSQHQPIGGINRLRKAVYEASSALRSTQ